MLLQRGRDEALASGNGLLAVIVGRHRVEVDIRPENGPSLRVVEKLGLRREGFYERFLDIDGGWRDHVAFAITVEELGGRSMVLA